MIKRNLPINEIFKLVDEQENREGKIEVLRAYDCHTLREILRHTFDPSIKFLLPKGRPPERYKANEFDEHLRLYSEIRRLYLFVEGGHPTLKQLRREQLFIDFLESLNEAEAEVIINMKDKVAPKGITKKLVQEAFPEIF